MSISERLIQLTLRARNFLSGDVKPATDAVKELAAESQRLKATLEDAGKARSLLRTLRDNEQATEGLQRAWTDAAATLDDLTREVGENETATAGQRIALREARRTAEEAERAYKRNQSAIKNTTTDLNKLGVDTKDLANEEQRLTTELTENKAALAANREAIKAKRLEEKKAADGAREHATRAEQAREAMTTGAKQVLAFAAAYVSLNAVFGLVQRGLNRLSAGIKTVFTSSSDEEQALAQLEAALVSTGNAAGLTAQQLRAMGEQIGRNSMLTGEQILAAQTRLLSYTDIAGTEFPRALQLVIDQQQRLGISAEQSAEIVGRALQAPADAMATLGRQGFKFTDQQKQLLQQLERTGQKAKAQTIIMDLMTEAYGGAAAAARMGTFKGLLKTIGDQFDDFGKKVGASGAFEYIKRRLLELSGEIDAMAADGRLDRLATALSDAFIQGIEWVEKFAKSLVDVDFKKLTDDSTQWIGNFGQHLNEAAQKVSLFILPFRALFNGITSGLSLASLGVIGFFDTMLSGLETFAKAVPAAMGGDALRSAVAEQRNLLKGLSEGFKAQIEQDGKDLEDALARGLGNSVDSAQAAADAKAKAAREGADAEKAALAEVAAEQEKLRAQMLRTFIDGKQVIVDMAKATELIQTAKTREEVEGLRAALQVAFQSGTLSIEQFGQTAQLLNSRLKDVGGTSRDTAGGVATLDKSLKDLAQVQAAISAAKTDVDINKIKTALKELYDLGLITAEQYNAEIKKTADRQKELKAAVNDGAKAQADKNKTDKEAIVTSAQLRRESGKRMEAERKAGDQAMQERRKGSEEAKRDMEAMGDFFGGVVSRAREPLAELSEAALAAYDKLAGISTVDLKLDTSSLDATTQSLERATAALGEMKAASNGVGMSAFGTWQTQTLLRSQQLQVQYLTEKQALLSLLEGYEAGTLRSQAFIDQASAARNSMKLLNDSDLRTLEGAIDAAKQQMEQLGASTRSTLDGLRMELLQLRGTEEEIERARFESRRREIQAQQAQARQAGDTDAVRNLREALAMLDEIESATAAKRNQVAQQKRVEEVKAAQPAPAAPAAPTTVIRLESARGRAAEVSVRSDADKTNLLGILEDAGLRSI